MADSVEAKSQYCFEVWSLLSCSSTIVWEPVSVEDMVKGRSQAGFSIQVGIPKEGGTVDPFKYNPVGYHSVKLCRGIRG